MGHFCFKILTPGMGDAETHPLLFHTRHGYVATSCEVVSFHADTRIVFTRRELAMVVERDVWNNSRLPEGYSKRSRLRSQTTKEERKRKRERGGGGWEETRQKGKKRALWNAGNGISFAVGKSSGWASSSPGCFFFPFFPFYDASNILGRFPRSLLSLKSFWRRRGRGGEGDLIARVYGMYSFYCRGWIKCRIFPNLSLRLFLEKFGRFADKKWWILIRQIKGSKDLVIIFGFLFNSRSQIFIREKFLSFRVTLFEVYNVKIDSRNHRFVSMDNCFEQL